MPDKKRLEDMSPGVLAAMVEVERQRTHRAERERDEARAKASEYHRRMQKAEAVIAKGIESQIGLTTTPNLGRALANTAAYMFRDERDAAVVQRDALRTALDRLVWLKGIKERMEAGTATDADAAKYHVLKERAWADAREALAGLEEE